MRRNTAGQHVLPDEPTLAAVLVNELAHIVLGQPIDSQWAFFDPLLVAVEGTFRHFDLAQTPEEDRAAQSRWWEFVPGPVATAPRMWEKSQTARWEAES